MPPQNEIFAALLQSIDQLPERMNRLEIREHMQRRYERIGDSPDRDEWAARQTRIFDRFLRALSQPEEDTDDPDTW